MTSNPKFEYMSGLLVPDAPLAESEILRKEASKNKIEMVTFMYYIKLLFSSCYVLRIVVHLWSLFSALATSDNAHHAHWTNENYCGNCRRVFVSCKFISKPFFRFIRSFNWLCNLPFSTQFNFVVCYMYPKTGELSWCYWCTCICKPESWITSTWN